MINKAIVKAKANELHIKFANLLAGAVCEEIIGLTVTSKFAKDLLINNAQEFNLSNYKDREVRDIVFIYCASTDKSLKVVLMDLFLHYIKNGASLGFSIEGNIEVDGISLRIKIDDMYVPVFVHILSQPRDRINPEEGVMQLSLENNKTINYLAYPKEQDIAQNIFEIISMLELISDLKPYYKIYDVLKSNSISGRKVKEALSGLCNVAGIVPDEGRMKTISGYKSYTYMKKRWKVELRVLKRTEPSWDEVMEYFLPFIEPIWTAMIGDEIFIGDWMPAIKRFLD